MGYYENYLQKKQALSGTKPGTNVAGSASSNPAYNSYLAKKALVVPTKKPTPTPVSSPPANLTATPKTPTTLTAPKETIKNIAGQEVKPTATLNTNLSLDASGDVVKKKDQNLGLSSKYGETTISAPAKQTFWSGLKNKIKEIVTPTDVVRDQVNYNLQGVVAKNAGLKRDQVPLDYVQKNRDAITKELGIRNQPTNDEIIGSAFTLAIIAGIIENPVTAIIGAAGYQATGELINLGISGIQREKYVPLSGKGLSDLLPADINPTIKGGVDILQFALQAKAYKTLKAKAPQLAETLTKDITTKYNLPEKIEIDKATVRQFYVDDAKLNPKIRQALIDLDLPKTEIKTALKQGVNIETSWEKVVTITDKPYWAKAKSIFKIPTSPTIVTITNLQKPTTIGGITALPEKSVMLDLSNITSTQGIINPGVYSSEQLIAKVAGSPLENTPLGNSIVKNSLIARQLNKSIVVPGTTESPKALETTKNEEVALDKAEQKKKIAEMKKKIIEDKKIGPKGETEGGKLAKQPLTDTEVQKFTEIAQRSPNVKSFINRLGDDGYKRIKDSGTKILKFYNEKSVSEKIPSYSEAKNIIQKEGGFANLKSLPAINRYAADEIGGSLNLNSKYLYEEATRKKINLQNYLKRIDAENNVDKKIEIGNELIKKLSENKSVTKYKTINEGGVIKEVEGKPIKLIEGVETFIHQGNNPKRTIKGFIVSEKTTGRYIATGETEKEAITNAKNVIKNIGEDKFKQTISQQSKKGTSAYADMGGYADIESVQKSLENLKSIEFPELLRLYTSLTNKVPALKAMRSYLGVMRGVEGGEGKIALSYEIFKNPKLAVKVFAHELGHLTDFFPDKTLKRGNLLGRIGSLRRYLKHLLPEAPGSQGLLTNKDRARLRREAKKLAQIPIKEEYEVIVGETKVTPQEIMAIWNDTMAGEKMPELMEFVKLLSEDQKKAIIKSAIKGIVPEWVNFGVLTKETRVREVIKNAPEDIRKKYQELVKEEIKKRGLFAIEEVTKELKALTQLWKPFNPEVDQKYTKYRFSSPELYADALSVLFNDPYLLKDKAPLFFKSFFNYLDQKPAIKEEFFKIQEILNAGDEQVFQERYKALEKDYKTAEETWLAQEIEKRNNKVNVIGMLNTLFNDKNYVINQKVQEAIKKGMDIADDYNPVYDLAGLNYMEGNIKEFVHDNFQEAVTIANKVENGWSELGKILQLERAIYERGELANPGGYDPKTAQWTLDQLEKKLGQKDWQTLQESKEIFRKGMQELVNLAEQEGYYNPELIAQMKANKAYATFQVLDYLDKNVTSRIYQAKGTLKGVANPATSSLMKMVVTLRAIRYNKSKKINLKFLKDLGELEPAKTKWNGKSQVPLEPRDKNKALVQVVLDGKTKGFYVDKEVGTILNHSKNETIEQLGKVTEFLTQTKIYRPLFTSINLGFQMFNFVKDFNRAWRNMPDKTLGQVFLSYPRLIGNYIKASPDAWKRAIGGQSGVIRQMESSEIFGLTMNDMMGTPDPGEEEVTRVLRRIGLVPGLEGRSKIKKIFMPVTKLVDGIEVVGNYIESLPKVASYNMLKEKLPEKELAYFIRNYIGSPDFLTYGTATPVTNKLFLFSNAIKEGVKTDLNRAFKSPTKGAWWFKMFLGTILPKMLQVAVALGILGAATKKMLDNVSEYDKTNYDIVLLGTDEKGKTIYLRVPKDESGRFVGAMTWKFMNMLRGGDKQTLVQNLTDIFSMWAGQVPGTSPSITGIKALSTYLSGKNPYDDFRNRNIIPDTEFKAGFKYSFPIMLKWLIQNQGGSIVLPSYTPKGEMTNLEKVLNIPVLSNMLGRFLKVSDYGQQEIDQKIKDLEEQKGSEDKIRRDTAIAEAIKNNTPLDITKALGHSPSSEDDLAKIKLMVKQMNIEKQKGKNTFVDNLIYANTNDEKVGMLKRYKETLTEEEFSTIVTTAVENKIISADVLKEALMPTPTPDKKLLNFRLVKPAFAAEGEEGYRGVNMDFANADGELVSVRPKNKAITASLLNKKQDVIEKIINVAGIWGVDPSLMVDLAYAENSFNVDVKGTNIKNEEGKTASTATGFYQFTKGTWEQEIIKKYADDIGIPKDAQREDVDANIKAAAWAIANGKLSWWNNKDNQAKFLNKYSATLKKRYGLKG